MEQLQNVARYSFHVDNLRNWKYSNLHTHTQKKKKKKKVRLQNCAKIVQIYLQHGHVSVESAYAMFV